MTSIELYSFTLDSVTLVCSFKHCNMIADKIMAIYHVQFIFNMQSTCYEVRLKEKGRERP